MQCHSVHLHFFLRNDLPPAFSHYTTSHLTDFNQAYNMSHYKEGKISVLINEAKRNRNKTSVMFSQIFVIVTPNLHKL